MDAAHTIPGSTLPTPARHVTPESSHDAAKPPSPERPSGSKLTWFFIRHKWATIVATLLITAGGVGLLSTGTTGVETRDTLTGEALRAYDLTQAAGFANVPTENIIVARDIPMTTDDITSLASTVVPQYKKLGDVADVTGPLPGEDGKSFVLQVTLDVPIAADGTYSRDDASSAVAPVLDLTKKLNDELPDTYVGQSGSTSVGDEMNAEVGKDFQRAEWTALPVTLVILLIAFGAVFAAMVPLALGIVSVFTGLGLVAAVSHGWIPMMDAVQSFVLLIGIAVGVDYALFIMRRATDEHANGHTRLAAIARAGSTAGRAVVISGATVVTAMTGLLFAGGVFTSIGVGGMIVVTLSVLASLATLPAILAALGDRVDLLHVPFLKRSSDGSTMWTALAKRVVRRPIAWASLVTIVLAALAVPAFGMKTSFDFMDFAPKHLPTIQAYERLSEAVPARGTNIKILVATDSPNPDQATAAVTSALAATTVPHLGGQVGEPEVSPDSRTIVVPLPVDAHQGTPEYAEAVRVVRADVLPTIESAVGDGAQTALTGDVIDDDIARDLLRTLPWIVAFVLALSFLVMLLSFGSPALAAATVVLNALSVTAAYGAMVLVFQNTWAEGILGFTSSGTIVAWLPTLMFVTLFGLSMDYHTFVTSRVREARAEGLSVRDAVVAGVGRSASVVTAAALVMVGVFSVFGTLSSLEMKQLGVGLAVAIALDATVVRGVLLPAVFTLLGDSAHRRVSWLPALHP